MAILRRRRTPRPTDLIVVTRLGHTFKASRRTVAHLDHTIAEFHRRYPSASLKILQTCYNTGVAASAGTHDYDAVFDFDWYGYLPHRPGDPTYGWRLFQSFLRDLGWFAWWRHTGSWAAWSEYHVHAGSIPEASRGRWRVVVRRFATKVGIWIDGGVSIYGRVVGSSQLVDYANRAFGLVNGHTPNSDTSWRPESIEASTFHYNVFVKANPNWKA